MIAFVFPGQGSQYVGMGKALAEAFPVYRETLEQADEALGEPLSQLCFEGPADTLTLNGADAAGCPRRQRGGVSPARLSGGESRSGSRAQPGGVLGARRGGYDILRRRVAHSAAARTLHATGGACRRGRHGSGVGSGC